MSAVEGGLVHRAMAGVGRLCVRRPWWVIAGWVTLTALVVTLVAVFGAPTEDDVSLPGSDAQAGRDLLSTHFSSATNASGQLILTVHDGRIDAAAYQAAIAETIARIGNLPHVTAVLPPSAQARSLSEDGTIGYLTITFDLHSRKVTPAMSEAVVSAAEPVRAASMRTVPAGVLAQAGFSTGASELVGVGVAVLVLLVAFGGLVAAGLPLVTALVTVACGLGLVGLAGHAVSMPGVAATLGTMIGLGVGIDYALFLVTRYRTLLAGGQEPSSAVVATVASSGSAVVFAGGTVMVALAGLAISGIPIITTLGWTAGLVVVIAVLVANTVLPAVLALLGHRVNALPIRRRARRAGTRQSGWARLADRVTARPVRSALVAGGLLVLLTVPVVSLGIGQTDAGDRAVGAPGREGYDLLSAGFGPGVNGPVTVAAELVPPASGPQDPRLAELTARLAEVPGVARVAPPRMADGGEVASIRVEPTTGPSDPATVDTVDRLRSVRVSGVDARVTGQTAVRAALADRMADRMPYVIAVVVILAALLIMFAFRSPVLAIKAAVMNLLSVGVAYGVLAAVFTWGWGVTLIGLDGPVPVESYVPMLLFALLFGLSMDYEVFLLTGVQESWRATGDNRAAVRTGLASTARVITSAALIMMCVFASFMLHDNPIIKMFGLGMTVAVAVDATIIRGILVPALMALLGRANWWTPRWLGGRKTSPSRPTDEPTPDPAEPMVHAPR
ncbi:MAG TPA: MMPL family transporter [Actinophytocola sp.]|uniref:MMPL family transporter n=1 Tax=Actinophytocola sp. TaxID=1872138 RepID=UPI002DB7F173|nr:MMPL family transporter [Actinophytocola sp.]HEU5469173.1 MMPL family transporter [Actinophytocola sp.]